ncbi:MAG: carbohydrate kinase [Chitinivibrionales bacterium]|nr:carbohydrate kinase [Chitinivibrionales bacterium]
MSRYHIAVIDVGKTNKKVLIFDDSLTIVDSVYENFEEKVEEGIHFEAVEEMTRWFKERLKEFSSKYDIKALSVTTHGATVVCIDKNGNIAVPPVAYTTETDEKFQKDFYSTFGTPEALQEKTATAPIGSLINPGKKIYFLQQTYPDQFKNVHMILGYPQYFGYVFTGNYGAEPTYVGCHTYLFDFENKKYSEVADKLGITDKLASDISKSWEVLGTISEKTSQETGLSTDCIVTMGIHDSNSSLLPFLIKGYTDFVLNSTGTWCVAMHPTSEIGFEQDELGKLVFYNLDAFYNPVKTSIFMGGMEYETYLEILQKTTGTKHHPDLDAARYRKIIAEKKLFILPSVAKGTGIFPTAVPKVVEDGKEYLLSDITEGKAVPEFFKDYETACAVCILSLAIQTKAALGMTGYDGKGTIFTEGGFWKNAPYNALLTGLYPDSRVALTQMQEATAFGAAILGKAALDKTTPMESSNAFEIEINKVEPVTFEGIDQYTEAFMELL